jgi:hypothetical protein
MTEPDATWNPPDAQEILIANIPDDAQWYEVRTKLKVLSYTLDRYDAPLTDAKALGRIFSAELFYCCKQSGKLTATRIW